MPRGTNFRAAISFRRKFGRIMRCNDQNDVVICERTVSVVQTAPPIMARPSAKICAEWIVSEERLVIGLIP